MAVTVEDKSIARVYARALLDSALAAGDADDLLLELGELLELIRQNKPLEGLLYSPAVDDDDRRTILDKLQGTMSDRLLNTLQVMNEKGRITLLPLVYEAYRHALEDHRGAVEVEITTAVPLTADATTKLETIASRLSGKKAKIETRINKSMKGGLVMRIGDQKFDLSLDRRLEKIHSSLLERASKELHTKKDYFEGKAE